MLIFKAIVYRVLRILLLLITAFIVLGSIKTAISISLIDAVVATVYYYYFDKAWVKFELWFKHKKLEYKYRKLNENKD